MPSRSLLLPLLLLLVGIFYWPSTQVGHLSDDWAIVSHVSRHGNADAWVGSWLGLKDISFHRPLFTQLYSTEYSLFGVDAFAAHVHHLLWCLLGIWVCFALTLRLSRSHAAAFIAGLCFAAHPYMAGVPGWLAMRAGVLTGVFTGACLLAWWRHDEAGTSTRKKLWFVGSLLCAALSVSARESGYLALVAPLCADYVLRPHGRVSLKDLVIRHLPFALLGIGLLVVRYASLGKLGGGYPHPDGLLAGSEAIPKVMSDLGTALMRILGGVSDEWNFGETLPIGVGIGTLVFLLLTLGLAYRAPRQAERVGSSTRRVLCFVLVLFLMQLGLLIVGGPTLSPSVGHRWYAAFMFMACGLGIVLGRAWTVPPHRIILAPFLIALIAIYAFGFRQIQDLHIEADGLVRQTLSYVQQQLQVPPLRKGPAFISNLPASRIGMPLCQWGFSEALRPPFTKEGPRIPVFPILHEMELGKTHSWQVHAPVEPLWYANGKDPLIMGLIPPNDPTAATPNRISLSHNGTTPEMVREFLRSMFPQGDLDIAVPASLETEVEGFPLSLPFTLQTPQTFSHLTITAYLQTVCIKRTEPITSTTTSLDLGPELEDYLRYRSEPATVFISIVAHAKTDSTSLALFPLRAFHWSP